MASDDEDEELKALRLAVLLSMKKKVEKEQSPPKKTGHVADLEALRHAALATIESAGVKPIVPQPIPSSNSPLFKSQSFPKVVNNNFNSSSPGPPRNRTRTSNLIVINPEPLDVPQKSVVSEKKSVDKPVLLRPQDKWCSPSTGTTISQVVEDSKPKVPSKFSRYDSSDSDSSDVSSDSESEEEKPLASPKQHSDSEEEKPQAPQLNSDSESDKRSLSPDTSSDSDSDDIEKQIDNILNSPEIKDKKTNLNDKTHEKVLKTKTPEKSIPVVTKIPDKPIQSVSKTEAPVSKKELHKSESKTIPTLIGGSKAGVKKKVSNAWSDSDSDSGIRLNRERQKLPKDKSWSDQGSSDEENKPVKNPNVSKSQMTAIVEPPPQQKTKAEIEKEKEDRRRMIENDLQKTLKALQSIKEKRRKQEAVQKGPKDSKNHRSPELKHRRRSRSLSPRRKSISPRRRNFDRRRSSSRSPRRRSFSPRRRRSRSYSRSLSRSPSGKRSPTSGLRKRKSPDSRRRRRSPLAFKGAYHRKSPYSKRSPKNIPSGNTSPDGQKEKRVLTSEERKKIEARRKKFENSAIEVKKTVSLKNIVRKSNSRERSPSPKINSPKDRTKKLAHSSKEFPTKKDLSELEKKSSESRRKSNELKENNDNQDSDASKSSVSSLSDSDSDEEESRSWRKEQNNTKHLTRRNRTDASDRLDRPGFNRPRYERSKDDQQGFERRRGGESRLDRPRSGLDRARKHDRSGLDRPRTSDRLGLNRQQTNDRSGCERSRASDRLDLDRPRVSDRSELDKSSDSPRSRKGKKNIVDEDLGDKIKTGINDNESNVGVTKKIYRSDSHVFSDNVDRGFDASNYRKTKIDSGVASDCSDSEEAPKEKKLISVVLPSDSKNNSPAQIITSPVRKVECSESVPTKSHRKHSKHRGERQKSKRVVITDMEEMPRKKKMKIEGLGDARNLLEAIKSQDNPRRAVIRKDGISVTLEDDQEPNSPRKPSVHERLGRKVPSLMSLKTEDLRRGKSPEPEALKPITQESKKSKDKSARKLERRDSSEKKSKKKRSIIHYDSPEEDTNEDNALEKRIQIIKEKNAAILKRQAEIQKDKEIFG